MNVPAATYSRPEYQTLTEIVEAAFALSQKANPPWHEVYFSTGELTLHPWEIIVRVRNAMCRGAADNGEMSAGAVDAWFGLGLLQKRLIEEFTQ